MECMHVNGTGEAVYGVIRNLDSSVSTEGLPGNPGNRS
jgi:hypothetical protein